jgi:hypothetical protein
MPPGASEVKCFSFNQDASCLVVGTALGVRVYRLHPFSRAYLSDAPGPTGIAELLFTTSLLALCGTGAHDAASPRRLRVLNTRDDTPICELSFVSAVLAVAMNHEFMAAVLENRVHLYSLADMALRRTVETAPNPRGTVALNADAAGGSFMAVPGTRLAGEVVVYECATGRSALHIAAHQTPIRCSGQCVNVPFRFEAVFFFFFFFFPHFFLQKYPIKPMRSTCVFLKKKMLTPGAPRCRRRRARWRRRAIAAP